MALPQNMVPEMVRVEAGEFWMGAGVEDKWAGDDEKPGRRVFVDAFWIARYPVTVAEYGRFKELAGWAAPRWGKIPRDKWGRNAQHPVMGVRWEMAVAYCKWLSKMTGRQYGLPSEAQWEKAARGRDGRVYPWGNEAPDKSRCNIDGWFNDTTPVGKFPAGDSPYGCGDMIGNVLEWCVDEYRDGHAARGGAWCSNPRFARCSYRAMGEVGEASLVGFRVVSLDQTDFVK